jgi:hypothetical protein
MADWADTLGREVNKPTSSRSVNGNFLTMRKPPLQGMNFYPGPVMNMFLDGVQLPLLAELPVEDDASRLSFPAVRPW